MTTAKRGDMNTEEIAREIKTASQRYHNGQDSGMTDAQWDALVDLLRDQDPDHPVLREVGAVPLKESHWEKVEHRIPMLSLNKAQSQEDIEKWAKRFRGPSHFVVMEKLDGISISLIYEQGKLIRASTRGDGNVGEDITRNVRRMKGVKVYFNFTGEVRGEVVCLHDDFKAHFEGFSNPRNTASGVAKRLDGAGCEHLTVICFAVVDPAQPSKKDELDKIKYDLGLNAVNCIEVENTEQIRDVWEQIGAERDRIGYDIDGLVVCLNRYADKGELNGRPKGAIAYKFAHEGSETVLRDIVWQTGASGRITPVAIFDPVSLAGAVVQRASLYNISYINELGGLAPGDTIYVSRRNDVIPAVESKEKPSGEIPFSTPSRCPDCGTGTEREGEYLCCPNTASCPAQTTGRVVRWLKGTGVLGWGDQAVSALCEAGLVKDPSDLYRLDRDTLASLELSGRVIGASADAMLSNLHGNRELDLHVLLGSLSLPMWGRSMFKVLVDAGYDDLDKIRGLVSGRQVKIAGVGDRKWQVLVNGFGIVEPVLQRLLEVGVSIKTRNQGGSLSGEVFCFTGFRDAELQSALESEGAEVKSSYTKSVTVLVAKDPNSGSSKLQKARNAGAKVVGVDAAWSMCRGES